MEPTVSLWCFWVMMKRQVSVFSVRVPTHTWVCACLCARAHMSMLEVSCIFTLSLCQTCFQACVYAVMLPITFQFILWCANRGILQSKNGQLYIKGWQWLFQGLWSVSSLPHLLSCYTVGQKELWTAWNEGHGCMEKYINLKHTRIWWEIEMVLCVLCQK